MNHIGLFEGIGGFSLAASWMDWETIAWCEWNPFGQQVLKYYFPKAIGHGDITKTDFTIYRGQCDILTGGFPCQPYSHAGKRLGKEDDRHLWPEMLRAIREIQPSWVVGENVSGLISWDGGLVFHEVQTDLEAEGYEVWPVVLPACAVNAPHRRDRVWFIAHSSIKRLHKHSTREQLQFETHRTRDGMDSKEGLIAHTNGSGGKEPKQQQPNLPTKSGRRNTETAVNPASQGREKREPNNGRTDSTEDRTGMDDRFERFSSKRIVASSGLLRQEVNELQTTGVEQCDKGNVTNPCNQGLQGSKVNGSVGSIGQERNKQLAGCVPSTWENFPTQPPICCRNDGLSSGLVGITVSKHRNESIKAYGNAIVPQVALQIFKAIEAMRTDFDKQ
jgi:DNA (cytosine-5)-methyltransferase 1